jgi:hypothetical protein
MPKTRQTGQAERGDLLDTTMVPTAPTSEPDRPSYKDILHQLFGTGEKPREDIDRDGGEANRNLRDTTARER